MDDQIKRTETSHICEVNRVANGSVQWFAEIRNQTGDATHPITHNNSLKLFICGEEGFADIADQINKAEGSIDLCCWGFDPGMELVRTGGLWPRGPTFGDLLVAAAKRFVKVRLLIWHDVIGTAKADNMPGYSCLNFPWKSLGRDYVAEMINAKNSLAMRQAFQNDPGILSFPDAMEIHSDARHEYCTNWYTAATRGLFGGLEVRVRKGNSNAINESLSSELHAPDDLTKLAFEKTGMVHLGTHHQKPILIDYAYKHGEKAVGYVMGLNSVTDYWCTTAHLLEDPRRGVGGKDSVGEAVQNGMKDGRIIPPSEVGFVTLKPYQDYACRIDGGGALTSLYANFVTAWDRATKGHSTDATSACTGGMDEGCSALPSALQQQARSGDSTVQIVRTQPEEGADHSIKEVYFQATDIAALGGGYLYLENQYFQYEDWSQRLIDKRKQVVAKWNLGRGKVGKSMEQMPMMHVFIVIPVPEHGFMVPRTYDTLAVLGQQGSMIGQENFIKNTNEHPEHLMVSHVLGPAIDLGPKPPPAVVVHANGIEKPTVMKLESAFGLKVSVAMLQTSAVNKGHWRYREIYIHSKLLLVDDSFFTLGSANLNQRSMVVDSELNMATDDPRHATDLRKRIFSLHSGGTITGGDGSVKQIEKTFKDWNNLMKDNEVEKKERRGMKGFLLPFEDNRSSAIRLS